MVSPAAPQPVAQPPAGTAQPRPGSLFAAIRATLPGLIPSERRVAEVCLRRADEVADWSAAQLATAAEVSTATVVRTCQSMGFRGFQQFRMAFAREAGAYLREGEPAEGASGGRPALREPRAGDPPEQIVDAVSMSPARQRTPPGLETLRTMTLHLEHDARLDPAADAGRVLRLAGSLNLRDLGDYRAADGRRVRRRTLLRSAAMHGLGDEARAMFAQLGVRTVVDLRERQEAAHEPDALGRLPITTRWIPIFSTGAPAAKPPTTRAAAAGDNAPGTGAAAAEGARAAQRAGAGMTLESVYEFILDSRGERLTAAVLALAEPGALPAIVHCSAGKDRTGLTIMLVLDLLGVPDEVIARDYAMTAELLGDEAQAAIRRLTASTAGGDAAELPSDIMDSPPALILKSLARVRASHGSARGYLRAHGATGAQLDALTEALLVTDAAPGTDTRPPSKPPSDADPA
jgi:protein-tyrosine phosphatase